MAQSRLPCSCRNNIASSHRARGDDGCPGKGRYLRSDRRYETVALLNNCRQKPNCRSCGGDFGGAIAFPRAFSGPRCFARHWPSAPPGKLGPVDISGVSRRTKVAPRRPLGQLFPGWRTRQFQPANPIIGTPGVRRGPEQVWKTWWLLHPRSARAQWNYDTEHPGHGNRHRYRCIWPSRESTTTRSSCRRSNCLHSASHPGRSRRGYDCPRQGPDA